MFAGLLMLVAAPAHADAPIRGDSGLAKHLLKQSYHESGRKAWHPRHHAFKIAMAQRGDPYRYGATGPNAFDCSGLMVYAYEHARKGLPRTSGAMRQHSTGISINHARPGDLVFFSGHVEMYAGSYHGKHFTVAANTTGRPVKLQGLRSNYVKIGRVA